MQDAQRAGPQHRPLQPIQIEGLDKHVQVSIEGMNHDHLGIGQSLRLTENCGIDRWTDSPLVRLEHFGVVIAVQPERREDLVSIPLQQGFELAAPETGEHRPSDLACGALDVGMGTEPLER